MTHLQINVVKSTRFFLISAMSPEDYYERHAAATILADFDDAIRRTDQDEFAHPQSIGRLCAAYERAVS